MHAWLGRRYRRHLRIQTENVAPSTIRGNLRAAGKPYVSMDAYEGPTASSGLRIFPDMGVGLDYRDTTVCSRDIGNRLDCLKQARIHIEDTHFVRTFIVWAGPPTDFLKCIRVSSLA